MNEYKISLSHDLVFHKRSNGVCTVTQGTDILPIELETAVNLLAEEIIEQQDKIDENKRQQEVTVHQFRQAQEEIQRLNKENDRFRKAFHQFANMKIVRTAPELVIQMYSRYAQELLEGRGMEGDAE
ncbi:hypothetical protein ABE060_11990 [Bacillus rugosus]|uniref:hypothetical protein n=1 Tax=Bacillus rugosus TaxID=2715209 RepID=UPI0014208DC3|nr:hypothetical protein [Bacillus rugosus]NUF04041.1 hypothetical protein [Bacillus rugosus]